MSNNSHFSDKGFYLGTIRGVRYFNVCFSVDDGLSLQSIYKDYDWEPGENVAKCDLYPFVLNDWSNNYTTSDRKCKGYITKECDCGFYAYHTMAISKKNSHMFNPVLGIIEGYGKVVVGTNGFRAEKARIVAATGYDAIRSRRVRLHYKDAFPVYDTLTTMLEEYPELI